MQRVRRILEGKQQLVEIVRRGQLIEIAAKLRVQLNTALLRLSHQPIGLPI